MTQGDSGKQEGRQGSEVFSPGEIKWAVAAVQDMQAGTPTQWVSCTTSPCEGAQGQGEKAVQGITQVPVFATN